MCFLYYINLPEGSENVCFQLNSVTKSSILEYMSVLRVIKFSVFFSKSAFFM